MSTVELLRAATRSGGVTEDSSDKSLAEVRDMVAALNEQLQGIKALRPQSWRWYRIYGGRRVLVGCEDREGDFPTFEPESGRRWVLRPDGMPLIRSLGEMLNEPLSNWCILIEDLGPAFSESALLEAADAACLSVMNDYALGTSAKAQKYLEMRGKMEEPCRE